MSRHYGGRRTMGSNTRFELVIQDEYLIILQSQHPQCLLIPRTNDMTSGISVEDVADFQHLHGRRMGFDAIYGAFSLLRGPYLALVTHSDRVAHSVDQHEIRLVTQLELMLIPTQQLPLLTPQEEEEEEYYISLLTQDIRSQRLHFSFEHDLTHTQQRIAALDPSLSIAERADRRFCWNYPAATMLLEQNLYDWLTPMVQAYIEVTESIHVESTVFTLFYISRRSCYRQGHRFTMRGIDEQGNVANFVETEQVAVFQDGRITSFVQIRGSIPLYWSSPVTMKYAPTVYMRQRPALDIAAFTKHAYELMTLYNRIVLVNLIDKKKEQLKLGEMLATTMTDAATADSHILANCRLVWFDFHAECRKMKYENLQKLFHQIEDDFIDYGFFHKLSDGTIQSTQSGVVRTNCMDNLDRTNVVQSLFARRSLLLQLQAIGDTSPIQMGTSVLTSPYPQFEKVFKCMWGNNADAISLLYAGTGALKTDFTRTGKRTTRGAVMDGYNSCLRYIINNFKDGKRQDMVDLLLGKHVVSRSHQWTNPAQERIQRLIRWVMGMVLVFWMIELWCHNSSSSSSRMGFLVDRLFRATLWTMVSCSILFIVLLKKGNWIGKRLVQVPSFRPQDGCMTRWK